jgi:uncharacterized phage-associated protein
MYSPTQVVNKFIELANASGSSMTHMQVQKLLYIAHGFNLAFYDEPLLKDPVCAWKYGPVIPSVYTALKVNRSRPIISPLNTGLGLEKSIDNRTNALLESIYTTYGKLNGTQLSEFTHRPGTPWSCTMGKNESIINDELIKDYYKRLIKRDPNCIGL